eukprot:CAMPEP_0117439548 /NCGR_PEP_ID=MMETSP0759-20121206/2621_1 /TAXON_ID=63605 /ORGANISM="Percolomonas cosmopolitus, Strain WS" /LENGTH=301 /DNA_ID=CAMNT_0005231265 /DNA_START=75 /DNA_END=977 /DNA_ORIENTATION=-
MSKHNQTFPHTPTIILLCGIPATGKSTLLSRLKQENGGTLTWCIEQWDNHYEKQLIQQDKGQESHTGMHFDPVQYKEQRQKWTHSLRSRIRQAATGESGQILIVEDNFYLNSMRRDMFLICQEVGAIYGEVILRCCLETSLQRNAQRTFPIPTKVIERMDALFEYNPRNREMKKRHLELDTEQCNAKECLDRIITFVHSLKPVENRSLEKQLEKVLSRQSNVESVKHQLDLMLRKYTASLLKSLEGKSGQSPNILARKLGPLRKEFISLHASHCEDMIRDHRSVTNTLNEHSIPEEILIHF